MKKYKVRDREAGNVIDEFSTYGEAAEALVEYEAEDKINDAFTPNFYEIVGVPAQINLSNGNGRWYDIDEVGDVLQQFSIETLIEYMDDDALENLAYEIAPCTDAEFLAEYLRRATEDLIIG